MSYTELRFSRPYRPSIRRKFYSIQFIHSTTRLDIIMHSFTTPTTMMLISGVDLSDLALHCSKQALVLSMVTWFRWMLVDLRGRPISATPIRNMLGWFGIKQEACLHKRVRNDIQLIGMCELKIIKKLVRDLFSF